MEEEKSPARLILTVLFQALVTLTLMPSIETQIASFCGIVAIVMLGILAATPLKLNDRSLQVLIIVASIVLWGGIWLTM